MDVFSKRKRSRIMSRIRSAGTGPERALRSILRALSGHPVAFNVRRLPGSPDAVVRRLRLAVFVDGCFWHRCPVHGRMPKSRVKFWRTKLSRNVARDRRVRAELRRSGWTVWALWEHDLKADSLPSTRRRLRRRLRRLERV